MKRRFWPRAALAAGFLALLAFLLLRRDSGARAARERVGGARAVPVVAESARAGDMGVYLSGLGSVTPVNTVTVRSRVDGQLVSVNYKEGQGVHKGDVLAQIDPRPFEVQLHQAEGQQARDEATLQNARVDLERYRVLLAQDSIPRQQLDTQAATVAQLEATLKTDQAQIGGEAEPDGTAGSPPPSRPGGLGWWTSATSSTPPTRTGLVAITQLEPITVVFTIAADQLPPGHDAAPDGSHLPVEAWDCDLKTRLASGRFEAVDNQIDETTGTVRLKAVFANEDTRSSRTSS